MKKSSTLFSQPAAYIMFNRQDLKNNSKEWFSLKFNKISLW